MPGPHGVPVWLECLTGPDLTKTALHLEPTGWVLVGDPSGDPSATGLGTCTPLCTLVYTVRGTRQAWPQTGGCDGILNDCVVHVLTDPLLAAPPRQLYPLGVWAVWVGKIDVLRAQGHACQPTPQAAALSGTGGLEYLAILIGDPVQLTAQLLLTDTLSRVTGEAGAVVTLQSSLAVTHIQVAAGLALLPGTHLAALAAVQDQRDSCWALGHGVGALAWSRAQLTPHLQ